MTARWQWPWTRRATVQALVLGSLATVILHTGVSHFLRFSNATDVPSLLIESARGGPSKESSIAAKWYPQKANRVNDLDSVINGSGTYGLHFDSSELPQDVPYGTYNLCNMPHVRANEYIVPDSAYQLEYVEVIHRHHRRTPYMHNAFPVESYPWACDDEALEFRATPLPVQGSNHTAGTYWQVYETSDNPLTPKGFKGSCQFPQLTRGGLDDSWQHGRDLFDVYHGLLGFIPAEYDPTAVSYRVTNNVITSQVAGMVISGMYPQNTTDLIPLAIQHASIDSLEPLYPCPFATTLFNASSASLTWQHHLSASAPLFRTLDAISHIAPDDAQWHVSWDHYFDNLSMRLAHAKPLPCDVLEPEKCISRAQADAVFRLGLWEYSYLYRDAGPQTLEYAVASYGIYVAELAAGLRAAMDQTATTTRTRYRHNVAHDGSVSRLLGLLQVEGMVWPGMGAEVVFELYARRPRGGHFLRVLWGGQVLRSSSPVLGVMDMVPVERVLGYFDELVGRGGSKIPDLCAQRL